MFDLEITEKDWNKNTVSFCGEENETISVYRKCPKCCRYIKSGDLLMNGNGDVFLENWTCSVCGEIKPFFDRY